MLKNTMIVAGICSLFALILIPITSNALAPKPPQIQQAQQAVSGIEYAQLTVSNGRYIFDVGGNIQPREFDLVGLQRSLGSRERATFVNLLNAIGQEGWELIPRDSSGIYLFKRNR
ncbi:MAG: hypothetical protein AAF623_07140 [Planctomycetota bacterium]